MARLEAQKAICDASEKELRKVHKLKDEIEKQIRPDWEQARKRSRVNDDFLINEDEDGGQKSVLYLPGIKPRTPLHKELRTLIEEEQIRASLIRLAPPGTEPNGEGGDLQDEELKEIEAPDLGEINRMPSVLREQQEREDNVTRKLRGKENVEKWLQMLLDSTPDGAQTEPTSSDLILKCSGKLKENECEATKKEASVGIEPLPKPGSGRRKVEGKQARGKEKVFERSESARTFHRIPSSPSLILGMKKGVDCIRKKSVVFSDDERDENYASRRNFLSSPFTSIKKAIKM
ncbi:hypothetical protein SAY87_010577 [Trapa incisa]|nr:hypothetical protein SAY87_010577 [Trapa incisa]